MEKVNQDSAPGETTKGDRIISTIESLMNGENNQKIIENLRFYYDTGRGSRTAVFSENIEDSEKQLWMNGGMYEKLKELMRKSAEDKREYAFIFFGKAQGDYYVLQNIVSDLDIGSEEREGFCANNPKSRANDAAVNFDPLVNLRVNTIVNIMNEKTEPGEKRLAGLGHTHPNLSGSYGLYSLPDLVNFASYEEILRSLRQGDEFEHCHIVLTENGDVDCMTFDKNEKRFKKIIDVISIGDTEADDVKIPAYTFQPDGTHLQANYTPENGESKEDELYRESIARVIEKHQWDNLAK
ncbi:hypothetical protein IKF04_01290 [Candidatus Saccharibacteria bacterium]|nr:hypothetical protein [Candidatus Saccharibacteria bacterium]